MVKTRVLGFRVRVKAKVKVRARVRGRRVTYFCFQVSISKICNAESRTRSTQNDVGLNWPVH